MASRGASQFKYVPQDKKKTPKKDRDDYEEEQRPAPSTPHTKTDLCALIRHTTPKTMHPKITCTKVDVTPLFPEKVQPFALILDGVFTEAECNDLIARTEAVGYEPALVGGSQVRVTQQRNNWRCMIDDEQLAEHIFQRVKNHVPTEWLGSMVVGLNERMRFLKYKPGEYFKPHNDGIYVRDDNKQSSYVTIHLYLNEVKEGDGGETTFTTEAMSYGRHLNKPKKAREDEPLRLSVRPVTGRVLIFEHHLPHEGSTLVNGVKYTVRTDVMYDLAGQAPYRAGRWGLARQYPHPQYKLPDSC